MLFDSVLEAKPDPIFGLTGTFQSDPRPEKVNLLVGIYKDEHLHSSLFPSVEKARLLISQKKEVPEYLPFEGFEPFVHEVGQLIFGEKKWNPEIFGTQAVGGTGALRVGAEFLSQEVSKNVYLSNPTWPNHQGIFEQAGFKVNFYTYYSSKDRCFDLEGMCRDLKAMPPKSIVILHAACHNPTGCDPTLKEWEVIADLMEQKKLVPFFDFAYQGFGIGIEEDAAVVRLFYNRGHEMLIAYSCSKNFSLYGHRVGALYVVSKPLSAKIRVGSQIKRLIRTLYSNPPVYGARLAYEVLKNGELRLDWENDLKAVRSRLIRARENLIQGLMAGAKFRDFSYLKAHRGMFSFVDLNKQQVAELIDKYGIYLIDNGRISIAGLSAKNTPYVVDAILDVSDR